MNDETEKIEKAIEELQAATRKMKAEVRRLEKRSAVIFAKTQTVHR